MNYRRRSDDVRNSSGGNSQVQRDLVSCVKESNHLALLLALCFFFSRSIFTTSHEVQAP